MPRASATASVSSWKRTMSTTGWRVGTSVVSQPSALERVARRRGALGGPALALQHVRAHAVVDRGEVAVQQLLRLVRVRVDPRALAQLEHRLLRGRPVATGADDDHLLACGAADLRLQRLLDRARQPADLLAVQRGERRDRARVARRVAPRALDLRRADDHLVGQRRRAATPPCP